MPGLGVSVSRDYGLALKRWDEAGSEAPRPGDNKENKQSLGDKIVSMFNLRRRNTVKEGPGEKSGTSVRRSQSMVTQNKKKLGDHLATESILMCNFWGFNFGQTFENGSSRGCCFVS